MTKDFGVAAVQPGHSASGPSPDGLGDTASVPNAVRYELESAIRQAVAATWGHILLNGETELADAALAVISGRK